MSATPLTQPPPPAAGLLARSTLFLLMCGLFGGLLWWTKAPQIFWYAMPVLFCAVLLWEALRPAQNIQNSGWRRWPANGVLWALNMIIGGEVGQACVLLIVSLHLPYGRGWVTNTFDSLVTSTLFCVVVLDFWQYLFHRLMHRWAWLWRIHRVHHSDRDYDLTTGLRFHPLEGVLTIFWRLAPVVLLGMPREALLVNAMLVLWVDFFTHANVRLPSRLERALRTILITPALHRIHHSLDTTDDRRNFGTIFSFWDRFFETLRQRSVQKQPVPLTGVDNIPTARSLGTMHTLMMPFAPLPPAPRPPRKSRSHRSTRTR